MIVGTALHDFGYGHDGVLMDGDVTLRPLRKVRLRSSDGRLDDVATSGVLDDPEAFGDVVQPGPDAR